MSSNQPPSTVQSPCAYSRNRYSECTCLLSNHLLQYNPPMPAVWTNTQWEQAASILLVQNFSGKLSLYFCIWATSPPSNTLDAAHIFIYFLFWKAAAVVLVIGQKDGRKEERQRERERESCEVYFCTLPTDIQVITKRANTQTHIHLQNQTVCQFSLK